MDISVFGLGYVGAVCSACLAKEGHNVIGVDKYQPKIDLINAGKSPIVEDQIAEICEEVSRSGRLKATSNAQEAIDNTELSIICVGTPSQPNGSLDLSHVRRVCQEIGAAIKRKGAEHTVVLRSTVLPGTTRNVAVPELEAASGRKLGDGLTVNFNPEFLREASSVKDFYDPPFTLIGEFEKGQGDRFASIFSFLKAPEIRSTIEVAEMVKYVCNTFHALKVAFANEIGTIGKSLGVDSSEVMRIFCMDDKLNINPYYFKPGYSFGGSCLPKDVRALLHRAKENDCDVLMLNQLLPSNKRHTERGIELVEKVGKGKKVGLLGLSFKAGTDDLRESPMVVLVETLLGRGYLMKIFDRNISLARLVGANKAYIEQEIPHISELLITDLQEILAWAEVLVVGNPSPEFREAVTRTRKDQVVVDLVRIVDDGSQVPAEYHGICW
jgi:GDP-mannose 6-dehydrogenase